MRTFVAALFAAAVVFGASGAGAAEERMGAEITCTSGDKPLVFDCLLKLIGKTSGQPIQGAALVVSADMPSMPMAHNVKPVQAEPTGRSGEYRFRIELEMPGEWALKLRLSKPRQDLIVHRMMFEAPRR